MPEFGENRILKAGKGLNKPPPKNVNVPRQISFHWLAYCLILKNKMKEQELCQGNYSMPSTDLNNCKTLWPI